jgi:ribonuclease T2
MARLLLLLVSGLTLLPALLPAQNVPGQFDFYVLSLSWSPEYCAGRNSSPNDTQCGDGRRFGFVLHGLWPQFEPRGWPQDCSAGGNLQQETVRSMLDIMPAEGLIRHEWRKHGTCTGLDARGYFALSRRAFEAVRIPPAFRGPAAQVNTSPAAFKKQLAEANPSWKPDSATLLCSGRFLQEVRVCLDRDLQPRPCPPSVRDRCNVPEMIVRPVR